MQLPERSPAAVPEEFGFFVLMGVDLMAMSAVFAALLRAAVLDGRRADVR